MDYGQTDAQRRLARKLLLERRVDNVRLRQLAEDQTISRQMMSQVISRLLECPARDEVWI
jgi:hypothetical protein